MGRTMAAIRVNPVKSSKSVSRRKPENEMTVPGRMQHEEKAIATDGAMNKDTMAELDEVED